MLNTVFAAFGLGACLLGLALMLIGPRRSARLRVWLSGKSRLRGLLLHAWHWPQRRAQARDEARQMIERARRQFERDGNVYRPKGFNKRPPDDKLH